MSHGPGMHGPLITALFVIALVAVLVYGLVYLVKSRRDRTPFERDPESDRGPEA